MRDARGARPQYRFRGAEAAASELASEWAGPWEQVSAGALLDILADGGCPVCVLTERAADAVITGILQAPRLPE